MVNSGRGRFVTGDKLWFLGAVAITTTQLCSTKSEVLRKFNPLTANVPII